MPVKNVYPYDPDYPRQLVKPAGFGYFAMSSHGNPSPQLGQDAATDGETPTFGVEVPCAEVSYWPWLIAGIIVGGILFGRKS